jgi:hypothetical protein
VFRDSFRVGSTGQTNRRAFKRSTPQSVDCVSLIRGYSAHGRRSVPAASGGAKPEKLLDPFGGIDLPCIDVALAVDANLM